MLSMSCGSLAVLSCEELVSFYDIKMFKKHLASELSVYLRDSI